MEAVFATGTVEATLTVPVAARTSARLIELKADEGADVSAGQVLGRLEDEDLLKSYEELKVREAIAMKEYDRNEEIGSAVSRQALERSESDLQAAHAAVDRAKALLDMMQLTSPGNCHIIRRDGEVGQLIPANQPVFWLSCDAPLRISADVDEEDLPEVKVDQQVLIRADAFPGQVFHGKVQSITPKGDSVARSFRVRVGFTEKTPLQIGMTAETNIITKETQNALLLPATAVIGNKVFLVVDDHLREQEVVVGAKGPERIEVKSGVSETDLVVRAPSPALKNGKKIKTVLFDWNK